MSSLGRYQVLRALAKVGADELFLAKVVDAAGADYHVVRHIPERVFEEARRAAWLRHPNLVAVRELGVDSARWYVATEYVHGEDLKRVLTRVRRGDDQVPIALVTAIGAAAAAGLHHAHTHSGSRRTRRGSVHGRVSPSSIIVGYDGSVKVGELGIASEADPSYLAPEQAAGAPIDRRTDVFALGIVLYELVTARRLFRGKTDALTKAAIAHASIPPPSRFRPGLPRALEDIILKALAPAPSDRFKSAGELRDALEAFARGLGMRCTPATIADYLKKLFGTRPFPWVLSTRRSSARITVELVAKEPPGVAAPPDWVLRELGVPQGSGREAAPGRGEKTPMAWTSQRAPAEPWSRRHYGIVAGALVTGALVGFLFVSAVTGGGGGDDAVVPMSAPPPPPPIQHLPPEAPEAPESPEAPEAPESPAPDAAPGDGSAIR
jgi:eukaryotic-like serine/threonine-protein kinase